jgi:hypothetical protein
MSWPDIPKDDKLKMRAIGITRNWVGFGLRYRNLLLLNLVNGTPNLHGGCVSFWLHQVTSYLVFSSVSVPEVEYSCPTPEATQKKEFGVSFLALPPRLYRNLSV